MQLLKFFILPIILIILGLGCILATFIANRQNKYSKEAEYYIKYVIFYPNSNDTLEKTLKSESKYGVKCYSVEGTNYITTYSDYEYRGTAPVKILTLTEK